MITLIDCVKFVKEMRVSIWRISFRKNKMFNSRVDEIETLL